MTGYARALLLAGLLLRLAYGWARPPQPEGAPLSDPDHYVLLAGSFADSWSLLDLQGRPTAEREPAYPIALGLAFKVFGKSYPTLLALNVLFEGLSLLLLYRIALALFGGAAALAALGLGAFYPAFVFYAAQPQREGMLILLGLLSVWSLLEARRRDSAAWAGFAGMANAASTLCKTTALPFGLILAPLALLWLGRDRPRRAAAAAAVYLAAFVAVYAPWPLRNHRVFGTAVLGTTEGGGNNFYVYQIVPQEEGGLASQGERMSRDPVVREAEKLEPIARDRFFWKAGLRRVREEPWAYAKLFAWRLLWDQWRVVPRPRPYAHSYALLKWTSLLSDGWIIPAAFAGMILVRLTPAESVFPYLLLFSTTFVYALVFTMLRYRVPLMPWLILFAGAALARAWEAASRRRP